MASSTKQNKQGGGSTILFVYGTLKHGQRNHGLMRKARFLGEAVTAPQYTLLDLGSFPGMIHGGTTAVHGELCEVGSQLLTRLDRHEGVPRFYMRESIRLSCGSFVESYLLVDSARIVQGVRIESGLWLSLSFNV